MIPEAGPQSQTAWQERLTVVRTGLALLLVLLLGRSFIAEPNHIPTGSMAPHRLGVHLSWVCPNCRFGYSVGIRTDGSSPAPVCPNCGFRPDATQNAPTVEDGDHLWVLKTAFDFLQPKRWQEVVFISPDEPASPHLKRVAGLPGETVQIKSGDLFINGRRDFKYELERKALSILVYDQNHVADDMARYPRWKLTGADPVRASTEAGWGVEADGRRLVYSSQAEQNKDVKIDHWANYWHFCPARGAYGPVTDFLAYEGREFGAEQVVSDLWFRAKVEARGCDWLALRLNVDNARIMVELPWSGAVGSLAGVVVTANGRMIRIRPDKTLQMNNLKEVEVELSWVDHRLECRLNGQLAFEPIQLEDLPELPPTLEFRETPVGFAVRGRWASVRDFQLFRDVYITDRPATDPLTGFAVREPVKLPADAFFLLGDNSGYSIDSRFWRNGPVVPRSALIGRPLRKSKQNRN